MERIVLYYLVDTLFLLSNYVICNKRDMTCAKSL